MYLKKQNLFYWNNLFQGTITQVFIKECLKMMNEMIAQNNWLLQMIDNFFKNLIDKSFFMRFFQTFFEYYKNSGNHSWFEILNENMKELKNKN